MTSSADWSRYLNRVLVEEFGLPALEWQPYYEVYDPVTREVSGNIKELATPVFSSMDAAYPYVQSLRNKLGQKHLIFGHVKQGSGYRVWIPATFLEGWVDVETSYLTLPLSLNRLLPWNSDIVPIVPGSLEDRAAGVLLGLAVGDALGITYEIFPSGPCLSHTLEQVRRQRQLIVETRGGNKLEMVGGGPWGDSQHLAPGDWSDDTSMGLCLCDSLIAKQQLDLHDLMQRFVRWWDCGENASCRKYDDQRQQWVGRPVGLGGNIGDALQRYKQQPRDGEAIVGGTNPDKDAGNGAIMRMAPVALFWHSNLGAAMEAARIQASVTHNVDEARDACALMAFIICRALSFSHSSLVLPNTSTSILTPPDQVRRDIFAVLPQTTHWFRNPDIAALTLEDAPWKNKTRDELITLPGRTLWSLEAALWCLYNTGSFETAMDAIIGLGGDADTTGAILGQLAGAVYGVCASGDTHQGIPPRWICRLKHGSKIYGKALALVHRHTTPTAIGTDHIGNLSSNVTVAI